MRLLYDSTGAREAREEKQGGGGRENEDREETKTDKNQTTRKKQPNIKEERTATEKHEDTVHRQRYKTRVSNKRQSDKHNRRSEKRKSRELKNIKHTLETTHIDKTKQHQQRTNKRHQPQKNHQMAWQTRHKRESNTGRKAKPNSQGKTDNNRRKGKQVNMQNREDQQNMTNEKKNTHLMLAHAGQLNTCEMYTARRQNDRTPATSATSSTRRRFVVKTNYTNRRKERAQQFPMLKLGPRECLLQNEHTHPAPKEAIEHTEPFNKTAGPKKKQ